MGWKYCKHSWLTTHGCPKCVTGKYATSEFKDELEEAKAFITSAEKELSEIDAKRSTLIADIVRNREFVKAMSAE